jgi:hypothetical protein
MNCPHCNTSIHADFAITPVGKDVAGSWTVKTMNCPECKHNIIILNVNKKERMGSGIIRTIKDEDYLVYPKVSSYPPAPESVPENISQDYNEACLVLNDSPRASSALSRRCLQNLLHDVLTTEKTKLLDLIDQAIEELPSYLANDIDAIRNIGNFAAHPNKNTETDEILDVEPHEAEWNIQVLQGLFDFYYVQKELAEKRRAQLNAKLEASGKPPMKSSYENQSQ